MARFGADSGVRGISVRGADTDLPDKLMALASCHLPRTNGGRPSRRDATRHSRSRAARSNGTRDRCCDGKRGGGQEPLDAGGRRSEERLTKAVPAAGIWWSKSRMRWKGLPAKHRFSGPGGGPIQSEVVTAREFIVGEIARLAARAKSPGDSGALTDRQAQSPPERSRRIPFVAASVADTHLVGTGLLLGWRTSIQRRVL